MSSTHAIPIFSRVSGMCYGNTIRREILVMKEDHRHDDVCCIINMMFPSDPLTQQIMTQIGAKISF